MYFLYVNIIDTVYKSYKTRMTKRQIRKSNLNGIVAIVIRFCEDSKSII